MTRIVKLTGQAVKAKVKELGWHENFSIGLNKSNYPSYVRGDYVEALGKYECILYEGVYSNPQKVYFDPDYEVIISWDVEEE